MASDLIKRFLPLMLDIKAIKAMLTWPKFSITAYQVVSDLFKQRIIPRTIIDVGANAGQFTIAALNIYDGVIVHAFEPVESCVDQLRINTKNYKGVHIYNIALGARPERRTFYENRSSLCSSLLKTSQKHRSEFPEAIEKSHKTLDLSTLDFFFSRIRLPEPVLLKIDVQGAEKQVIEGGRETLKQVEFVMLEASFTPMYLEELMFLELIHVMSKFKFEFVRPISFLKSPKSGEILQSDILFKRIAGTI